VDRTNRITLRAGRAHASALVASGERRFENRRERLSRDARPGAARRRGVDGGMVPFCRKKAPSPPPGLGAARGPRGGGRALLRPACASPPRRGDTSGSTAGADDRRSGSVVILAVNDVYRIEGIEGGKRGGLARLRTVRAELERATPGGVLLLHGGDVIFPS